MIFLVTFVFIEGENFAFEAMGSSKHAINDDSYSALYLKESDDYDLLQGITVYSIFNFEIFYDRNNNMIMGKPQLNIVKGHEEHPQLMVKKYSRNVSIKYADDYLDELEYNWEQDDSVLYFDRFFIIG